MKKIFNIISILILVSVSFFSCHLNDSLEQKRAAAVEKYFKHQKKIKIAAAGPWAQHRDYLLEGIELAVENINSRGGVLGAQIELVKEDDNYNLEEGQKAGYRICEDKSIGFVIGHQASSISLSNSLIYHYYGLLQMSPRSTSIKYTNQGLNKVFRNIPSDNLIGQTAGLFCRDNGFKNVIVYQLNSEYGRDFSNAFELTCNKNDVYIVARVRFETYDSVQHYVEDIRQWNNAYNYDSIFIAGTMPQIAEIISVIRDNGVTVPIISGETLDYNTFFEIGDNKNVKDVYSVTPFDSESENPSFAAFKKEFISRYGIEPDQSATQGYDAVMVLAKAMENSKSVNPGKVSEFLKSQEQWNEAAGPYRFTESGDVTDTKIVVKKSIDGKFVKVTK